MSSDPVIAVRGVGKIYRAYDHPLYALVARATGGRLGRYKEFRALQDVSFEAVRGESVGIVGRNGSGKSTLLQLICGIRQPTTGSIAVSGRISALLELGSGFHPDFTGRENVFMQGAIVGLTRKEMELRFDDIATFADIGEYLDQPVKTYSSGMFMRLAFAVAVSVDPDILIVDEALAVGDERFQRKCFSRIAAMKERGTTILFVSHSGAAIIDLCDRAILLDDGQLLTSGKPKHVLGRYQRLMYAPTDRRGEIRSEIAAMRNILENGDAREFKESERQASHSDGESAAEVAEGFFDSGLSSQSVIEYESLGAIIRASRLVSLDGKNVNCLHSGQTCIFAFDVHFSRNAEQVRFGMLIKTTTGNELGGAITAATSAEGIPHVAAHTILHVEFRFKANLNPGTYFLNAGVLGTIDKEDTYLHRILDAFLFKILSAEPPHLATSAVNFGCVAEVTEAPADDLHTPLT